ncbi:LLM class flavin-dependent oxidoreductase [Nocardia macrotermitis]|uniref:F420-dependent glucose-6-phosphate dehydrogenase n=1 Tax=Nocardia macrotermitis TaxID=2585198 RepID=A0A7K0CZ78_9NOCA|nr:LLM class flavin-dependent oxidoreductase [Nocardia macrotermitis]MQY18787.1 F420-dependent glucose-6-phosphate dehydrogenase [Nocardia macrotermitis]
MVEWFLFLPQIRMGTTDIVERAQVAEAAGFDGIAFIDHLLAPGAEQQPLWEAMTIATWVAARTERLKVGHLVLCDAFRQAAVLAKQAVTLQEASGGRFELGLGAGSVPGELTGFDITLDKAAARRERLGRTLELLHGYWGEADGTFQPPRPSTPIPIVIGGSSAPVLNLVRRHATWWNLPVSHLDRLESLKSEVGAARISVQQMVGFVGRDADAEQVRAQSERRFGYLGAGLVVGDAAQLTEHFTELTERGVERFYVWFADFAAPQTLTEFGETVIATGP